MSYRFGHLWVDWRYLQDRGRVQLVEAKWEGPPIGYVDSDVLHDLDVVPSIGTLFRVGRYAFVILAHSWDYYGVVAVCINHPLCVLEVLKYFSSVVFEKVLYTLVIWNAAERHLERRPVWRDVYLLDRVARIFNARR